jgi:hypothetical protein
VKILLTALVLLAAPATAHGQCATINNTTNTATWKNAHGVVQSATYRDLGGPRLVFSRPVPRAVRAAEAKLQLGAPGPKVRTACVR